jgi:hypothetical protein
MSSSTGNQRGLELDQDMPFQERAWRAERIAWIVLTLIVVAALIGLFGTGPLSSTTAGNAESGLTASYERFVRHDGQSSLELQVSPDQASEGQVEVWLSAGYLEDIELQQLSPQPDEVRTDGERDIFVFLVDDPASPISITLLFRPDTMGRISGDIGVVDGPTVSVRHISLP